MNELREHLEGLPKVDPPTETDLRVAAEALRKAAQREAEPTRGSLLRVADFAATVAPTIGVLAIMAENGTLPSIPGIG